MGQDRGGEELILVDENDDQTGFETKLGAHQDGGKLHRAFSIFILDRTGRMLLQRRAKKKYHFGGLWTNACCGHPKRGEELNDAARVRLEQEFGFSTEMEEIFSFIYRATDPGSGLTEHEFDHVLWGEFDGEPQPNPDEIDDWKRVDLPELLADLKNNPHIYTPWFKIALRQVIEKLPNAYVATVSRASGGPFALYYARNSERLPNQDQLI